MCLASFLFLYSYSCSCWQREGPTNDEIRMSNDPPSLSSFANATARQGAWRDRRRNDEGPKLHQRATHRRARAGRVAVLVSSTKRRLPQTPLQPNRARAITNFRQNEQNFQNRNSVRFCQFCLKISTTRNLARAVLRETPRAL